MDEKTLYTKPRIIDLLSMYVDIKCQTIPPEEIPSEIIDEIADIDRGLDLLGKSGVWMSMCRDISVLNDSDINQLSLIQQKIIRHFIYGPPETKPDLQFMAARIQQKINDYF